MWSRRNAERGEGNFKLFLALAMLIYLAYIAIQNVPIYLSVENTKHDLDEITRSAAAEGLNVPRIQARVDDLIIKKYDVKPSEIKISRDNLSVTISYDTVRQLNFVFYKYDWPIHYTKTDKAI
jgi:hypothetical protein